MSQAPRNPVPTVSRLVGWGTSSQPAARFVPAPAPSPPPRLSGPPALQPITEAPAPAVPLRSAPAPSQPVAIEATVNVPAAHGVAVAEVKIGDKTSAQWVQDETNAAGYIDNTFIYMYDGTQKARQGVEGTRRWVASTKHVTTQGRVT